MFDETPRNLFNVSIVDANKTNHVRKIAVTIKTPAAKDS